MSALPASASRTALPASATRPRLTIWIVYGVMGVLLAAYFARELSGANHYSSLVDGWRWPDSSSSRGPLAPKPVLQARAVAEPDVVAVA